MYQHVPRLAHELIAQTDCSVSVVIITICAVGQFIKDEASITQLRIIVVELTVFYEVGKHIVLFKYALAILFLKPFHFRTLAFGKSFTAGHTGFPLVCKLGEPLIPALASQICVSVHRYSIPESSISNRHLPSMPRNQPVASLMLSGLTFCSSML